MESIQEAKKSILKTNLLEIVPKKMTVVLRISFLSVSFMRVLLINYVVAKDFICKAIVNFIDCIDIRYGGALNYGVYGKGVINAVVANAYDKKMDVKEQDAVAVTD